MLAAVAAASLETIRRSRTKPSPKRPMTMMMRYKETANSGVEFGRSFDSGSHGLLIVSQDGCARIRSGPESGVTSLLQTERPRRLSARSTDLGC
jgi:hypothetical protein